MQYSTILSLNFVKKNLLWFIFRVYRKMGNSFRKTFAFHLLKKRKKVRYFFRHVYRNIAKSFFLQIDAFSVFIQEKFGKFWFFSKYLAIFRATDWRKILQKNEQKVSKFSAKVFSFFSKRFLQNLFLLNFASFSLQFAKFMKHNNQSLTVYMPYRTIFAIVLKTI